MGKPASETMSPQPVQGTWAALFENKKQSSYTTVSEERIPLELRKQIASAFVTNSNYVRITLKSGEFLASHLLDFNSPAEAGDELIISSLKLVTKQKEGEQPLLLYYGKAK